MFCLSGCKAEEEVLNGVTMNIMLGKLVQVKTEDVNLLLNKENMQNVIYIVASSKNKYTNSNGWCC